jgi:hypothetical protein
MNVVKTGDGRFIEIQGTVEGPPPDRALDDLPSAAPGSELVPFNAPSSETFV